MKKFHKHPDTYQELHTTVIPEKQVRKFEGKSINSPQTPATKKKSLKFLFNHLVTHAQKVRTFTKDPIYPSQIPCDP